MPQLVKEGKHVYGWLKAGRLVDNKLEFSVVFGVFLFGFLFFLWIFVKNELVPMVDGPYYLIQVRSLLTTGGLVYGDPPLTFYLMSFFSVLVGDVSLGVKLGVSFFSALTTVPTYFLMKRVGKGMFAGVLAMLFVVFSAVYIRMFADFMKNAIGVCWVIAFVYYLHDLTFNGNKKNSLVLAAFFLVLSGLTHILAFGVALLFLAFYTVVGLVFNGNRWSLLKSAGFLLVVVGVFVVVASLFFGSLFTDFTKALSFINEILQFQSPQTQAPITGVPFGGIRPRPVVTNTDMLSLTIVGGWEMVAVILFVGGALSFFAWRNNDKQALVLLSVSTVVGLIVSFPLLPSDLLNRFLLMMVIPTTIAFSYGISKIWNVEVRDMKIVATVLVVICLIFFVGQSLRTVELIRPTISNEGYLDLVDFKNRIGSDAVVVTTRGHGLGYWVEYAEDSPVVGVPELSPELWQHYSQVFGIFVKGQIPFIPHRVIETGSVYVLVEVNQFRR